MDQNISRRGLKRRRANSQTNRNQRKKVNMLREKVNILDETWLSVLKFLTCSEWSQKCFVSRQINGIVQRNISHLPKMVLDSADMYYIYEGRDAYRMKELEMLKVNKNTIVAFDTVIRDAKTTEWFKNRGFTLCAPKGVAATNALIGVKQSNDAWVYGHNVNVCIHGPGQDKILLSEKEMRFPWFDSRHFEFKKPVLYYAQFNPVFNENYWDYLAHFLKCVYHPASHIKKITMHGMNQDFIDSLEYNIDSTVNMPRYIRCESFSLKGLSDTNINDNSDLLNWLKRNVRAETIHIPWIDCDAFAQLANFLLDQSGAKQCASKKMDIRVSYPVEFLEILIQKFRTIPPIKSAIPTIVFSYPAQKTIRKDFRRKQLGPNLVDQGLDSQCANSLNSWNSKTAMNTSWLSLFGAIVRTIVEVLKSNYAKFMVKKGKSKARTVLLFELINDDHQKTIADNNKDHHFWLQSAFHKVVFAKRTNFAMMHLAMNTAMKVCVSGTVIIVYSLVAVPDGVRKFVHIVALVFPALAMVQNAKRKRKNAAILGINESFH